MTDYTRFAVGARIFHYFDIGKELDYGHEWIVLRDDIGLEQEMGTDPGLCDGAIGTTLQFRQAIETVMNENRMVRCTVKIQNQSFQLICSPLPLVCDEQQADGILWMVQECLQAAPHDLENVLLIFGRITANWLSKYNECLADKINPEEHTVPTVTETAP